MTEKAFKKFDGKRVRFSLPRFKYAVRFDDYEGIVEIIEEQVSIVRDGGIKTYPHISFYLHREGEKSILFDHTKINLIGKIEVLEDE